MNQNLTLYQVPSEVAETLFARIDEFNRGRTEANGCYAISTSTAYRSYYAFWRIFPNDDIPLFIRTLAVTFDTSIERAFTLLQNCNVKLKVFDNRLFESYSKLKRQGHLCFHGIIQVPFDTFHLLFENL